MNINKNKIYETGKVFIFILALIIAMFNFSDLMARAKNVNKKNQRVVIDQTGRSVKIPEDINRIVVLPMPLASVIFAVNGSAQKIVGIHPIAKAAVVNSTLNVLASELNNAATGFVKDGFTVNIEELLKLKPDIVIQWDWMGDEIKKIENAGIPVIAIKYGNQECLEGWIKILGVVLKKEQRASELINFHHEVLKEIKDVTDKIPLNKKPRVMYLYNEKFRVAGKDTYNNFWMELTGAVNVVSELSGVGKQGSMEQILKWNPDIIYIGNFCSLMPEDLYENKIKGADWSSINAIKNRKVFKIPLAGYRWDPPSVESPLMWKWLAQKHHPKLFKKYSMEEELKKYYLRFYNYRLSNEKIKEILRIK